MEKGRSRGVVRVRHLAALTLAVAVCALVGSTSATSGAPAGPPPPNCDPDAVRVNLSNVQFVPGELTVPPGTTVCWVNQDAIQHTVTSDTGVFDSGDLIEGQTFSFTFTEAGTYDYHCVPHQGFMVGTIHVNTGPPPGPPPPTISPEYAVSDPPPAQQGGPRIAFDGANYLATWRQGSSSVLGGRVDQGGNHLDGPGIQV